MTHATSEKYHLKGTADARHSLDEDVFEAEVEAEWFTATIDRRTLRQLMQRSDAAGYRHFAIWGVLLVGSGVGIVLTWWSWWTVPLLAVYGPMYAMSDHHAHELSHGTPFKNRRVNEALFQINSFMTLHEPVYWRWSHTRHHTNTLVVGRDPEIAVQRPPVLNKIVLDFFFIRSGWALLRAITVNALGKVRGDGEHFVPQSERAKAVRNSRIYLMLVAVVVVAALVFQTWLPVVLLVTPRFWGGPMAQLFNITQHAGLPEDVYDHRLNCRTVILNPVFGFLYMNMQYHVEHHMFPMVPFHALPRLHDAIKDQCSPPSSGVLDAWRELWPAVRRQRADPTYAIVRDLPAVGR